MEVPEMKILEYDNANTPYINHYNVGYEDVYSFAYLTKEQAKEAAALIAESEALLEPYKEDLPKDLFKPLPEHVSRRLSEIDERLLIEFVIPPDCR